VLFGLVVGGNRIGCGRPGEGRLWWLVVFGGLVVGEKTIGEEEQGG